MSDYRSLVSRFVDNEVFVVSHGEYKNKIHMFLDQDMLSVYMDNITITSSISLQIHHGILCKSNILPTNFKNQKPYVIAFDDDSDMCEGIVIDSTSKNIHQLAKEIEDTASFSYQNQISSREDISNIYVLYGYQINIKPVADIEDLDDEAIESAKEIMDEIENIEAAVILKG